MRLFLAVETAGEFLDEALSVQKRLRTCGADVKWVSPEQLHFTLHFLGEVPPEKTDSVKNAFSAIAQVKKFEIRLGNLGAFPPDGAPRVIWLGLAEGAEGLSAIHSLLGAALSEKDFEIDTRPFSPHLTLGRVKSQKGAGQLASAIAKIKAAPGAARMWVESVSLIESKLFPSGPQYCVLAKAELA